MAATTALVLGGGGMKGLAHVGVLKALHRAGIVPRLFVGTSVGAYVAALAAGGMDLREMEDLALSMRRRDILDYDWLSLLLHQGRARSLYRGKALHDFVRRTLPVDRFDDLPSPLYVTSVDLATSREVVWGMPGYREIPIHDCVVASCSLPGIYPPKKIGPFQFVDGGLVDPLPLKVATYLGADLIVAVYLDPPDRERPTDPPKTLGAMLEHSQAVLSRTLVRQSLAVHGHAARILLIQPRVAHHGLFDFDENDSVIRAGELATDEAIAANPWAKEKAPAPPEGETGAGQALETEGLTEGSGAA